MILASISAPRSMTKYRYLAMFSKKEFLEVPEASLIFITIAL
ncbi:MAG: hypothetical protein WBK95_11175 [Sulfurimonas sp.]